MARISTPGIWLPGALNTLNSSSPTAQADIAGNPYYMGLNPGKLVVLSTQEAQSAAAGGTIVSGSTLYDGAYQVVQLDSGATAAQALAGSPAFILLNKDGAAQGTSPETAYTVPVVTTADIAYALYGTVVLANAFFCGVFINPSTVNGASTAPTPGNYVMMFAGAGRVAVNVGSVASVTLGQSVFPDTNHAGKFESTANKPVTPGVSGIAVTTATNTNQAVAYYPDIIFRFIS
jgi:hypothetical protein